MNKRLWAALLALCLTAASALPALAAGTAPAQEQVVRTVQALGIMTGDEKGDMNLQGQVTRAEFVTMAVRAAPGGGDVGQAAASPYPDVPRSHWAAGYVEAGVRAGLVSGYSDGTFRPDRPVTLAEGATMALQLLGYGPADLMGAYPAGQLAMYRSLGLDAGVSAREAGTQLTRRDAMYLFYNLLTAKTKEGQAYLTTLGYSLNDRGEIDLVGLVGAALEGPLVARGDWQAALPLDLTGVSVTRNGTASSLQAVQEYDVLYYSTAMNALWAYSDKVTGTVQALEPSAASPASVTVAGRTLAIESAWAAYDLSDLGSFHVGDAVTLLLGRGGGVAAVARASDVQSGAKVGVVTAVDTAAYSDGRGGTYTARTVTLLATDGLSYRYQYDGTGLSAGSLARAAAGARGETVLTALASAPLSGRVSGDGGRIGSVPLAPDAEILDVSGKQGVRVYPGRLAGLDLTSAQVEYWSKNAAGEIDRLILDGVTGDMYRYGVLTDLESAPGGMLTDTYTYCLELGGSQVTLSGGTTRYPVEEGPICLRGTPEEPEKLVQLLQAGTGTVSGGRFEAGGRDYTLSDQLLVYELRENRYYLTSLEQVQGMTLTGWYDKTDAAGGRLRVIVARTQ